MLRQGRPECTQAWLLQGQNQDPSAFRTQIQVWAGNPENCLLMPNSPSWSGWILLSKLTSPGMASATVSPSPSQRLANHPRDELTLHTPPPRHFGPFGGSSAIKSAPACRILLCTYLQVLGLSRPYHDTCCRNKNPNSEKEGSSITERNMMFFASKEKGRPRS